MGRSAMPLGYFADIRLNSFLYISDVAGVSFIAVTFHSSPLRFVHRRYVCVLQSARECARVVTATLRHAP